jgi:hypothetical protein
MIRNLYQNRESAANAKLLRVVGAKRAKDGAVLGEGSAVSATAIVAGNCIL